MSSPYPFGFIGNAITRSVTLELPSPQVRRLLPSGLELGDQDLTPPGTHPMIFHFHQFSECQFSFPVPRSMRFCEQTAGIPFTMVRGAYAAPGGRGPYYFMPKLYLDDLWVLLNGVFWWGFNKEIANVEVSENRYAVTSFARRKLVSLEWRAEPGCGRRPVGEYPEFEPIRHMLSQTLITRSPGGVGPCFSLTDFERRWPLTQVQPLRSVLDVYPSCLPGFDAGRFGESLQSYEIVGPWWLSAPYQMIIPGFAA